MEERYYKVVVCRNSGEEPYYIKVTEGGEFSSSEFAHESYNFFEDSKINPSLTIMLNNGECVKEIQEYKTIGEKIKKTITEENTFDISQIKTFESCEECNKIGYALKLEDGTIIYPSNSDEFKPYEDKYIKIQYYNSKYGAEVIAYKYHTKEKDGEAIFVDGCFSSYDEMNKDPEIKNKSYNVGRYVSPEVLTKKLTEC